MWISGFSSSHYCDVKIVFFLFSFFLIWNVQVPLHLATQCPLFYIVPHHWSRKHYVNTQLNSCFLFSNSETFSSIFSVDFIHVKCTNTEFCKWMLHLQSRVFPELSDSEALSGKICYCRCNSAVKLNMALYTESFGFSFS